MASSESDSDWEDAEVSAAREGCRCLFCSREFQEAGETLEHCSGEHGADLLAIKAKLGKESATRSMLHNEPVLH